MKLADWLHEQQVTPGQLRSVLGVASRSTVRRWLTGERRPTLPMLQRIIELTGGRVQLKDSLDRSSPDCVKVVRQPDGGERWVFPWSPADHGDDAWLADAANDQRETAPSSALMTALAVLERRARMTRSGQLLLDGRPSDARRIVREANRVLVARGERELVYPGLRPWAEAHRHRP